MGLYPVTQSMEGIVDSRVNAHVFAMKFREIRKCLRIVYLQDPR
jgi:hypothetical protein